MKITMALMRMVDVMASQTSVFWSRLFMAAKIKAPTEPIAPPSVGVARPIRIVPKTKKISAIDGTMPQRIFLSNFQSIFGRASGGSAGTSCGLKIDRKKMNRQKRDT